jgi:hypothetical protein
LSLTIQRANSTCQGFVENLVSCLPNSITTLDYRTQLQVSAAGFAEFAKLKFEA